MNHPEREAKRVALEAILERAAEEAGDITRPVIERFYARFPDARAAFLRLADGDLAHVEARMVENCLYCVMEWWGRPGEVAGLLEDSVPHHVRTLEVSADWYWGMLEEALAVLGETIAPDAPGDRALWNELADGLRHEIAFAAGG